MLWASTVLVFLSNATFPGLGQTIGSSRDKVKESSGENDPARFEQARKWIEGSITSYGGNHRLTSITDLSFVSQSTGPEGAPAQFKVYFKGPEKFRSEVFGTNFFAMTITDGPNAWLKSDQTLIELSAGDVEPLKLTTMLQSQPYVLFDRLTKFWAQGDRTIDGIRYLMVGVSGFLGKNYTRGEIALDPQTFLIRRFEYEEEVETKQGKGVRKHELHYEDYRAVDGIQLPSRVLSIQTGNQSVTTFSEFKINPGIPDSFFEKPK